MKKFQRIIIWPIIAAPAIYLLLVWNQLPDRVAYHFGLDGQPDEFGHKSKLWFLVGLIAAVATAIYLFLPLIYKIDPRKTAIDNKSRLSSLAFAVAIFMAFIGLVIINSVVRNDFKPNVNLIFGGLGVLWCILGNYMYNMRPNYFAGFRLPWTLANETNWRLTHRLGAKLWFVSGVIMIMASFILPQLALVIFFASLTMITVLIPVVFSYRLYKKTKSDLNAT